MTRRRRTAAGLLVAAVVLTACAPVGDPSWVPPNWTPSEIVVVDAPDALDPVDDGAVASRIVPQRIRNDVVGVQARFTFLPGTDAAASAFNAAVERRVRDAIATAVASSGTSYTPQAQPAGAGLGDRSCIAGSATRPAAELLEDPALGAPGGVGVAVVCDIVAASGSILAQRLRTIAGAPGAVSSDVTSILYVDTATGDVATAEGLWAEGAAERLSEDVVDALRRSAGALSWRPAESGDEGQLAAIRGALASTTPAPGGLTFTIPAGFTAPQLASLGTPATEEPLTIAVPTEVASGLVTDFGARVLASEGVPFDAPVAGPAGADRVDCGLVPCVAVTYDDGPTSLTPKLLDELADARAAATFFMLGSSAANAPDTVRRVAAERHEIGNHTWSHPQLPEIDDEEVASQLQRTTELLRSLSGQAVASFRPPYGEYTDRVLEIAAEPAILWSVDTRDWAGPADETLIRSAVDGATPGGIILFHDTHERSVRVAPTVFSGLADRGFTLVTVTTLFGGQLPASGAFRRAP